LKFIWHVVSIDTLFRPSLIGFKASMCARLEPACISHRITMDIHLLACQINNNNFNELFAVSLCTDELTLAWLSLKLDLVKITKSNLPHAQNTKLYLVIVVALYSLLELIYRKYLLQK
jgi:hypothetical protein